MVSSNRSPGNEPGPRVLVSNEDAGAFALIDAHAHELVATILVGKRPRGLRISQPITFRGPDGRQHVAVYSGVGGWAGAMRDLPGRARAGGALHVFALPR